MTCARFTGVPETRFMTEPSISASPSAAAASWAKAAPHTPAKMKIAPNIARTTWKPCRIITDSAAAFRTNSTDLMAALSLTLGGMIPLARRNLLHDRTRFLVTVAGIAFAIVLVIVQLGLFVGLTQTTSGVIDHSRADLWVMARGVQYFEVGFPVSERKLYRILAEPGVAAAEKCLVQFAIWQRPDGARKNIEVIGFDPYAGLAGPWNISAGSVADLEQQDTVMLDEFYRAQLGVARLGDSVEING